SPHHTNQPVKIETDRVLSKYSFCGTRRLRSSPEEFELPRRIFLGQTAQPLDESLDAVLDSYGRMTVPAREFLAGHAPELELNQQMTLLTRKPSRALAV